MSFDLAKYRGLFLDEARDHLGELSGALLVLEKDSACSDAIDLAFRMAHSIKGMAASLGYDAITEVAHTLEDRLHGYRTAGRAASGEGIGMLFRGLEGLERMVAVVAETGEGPPADPELVAALGATAPSGSEAPAPDPRAAPAGQDTAPPKKAPRRR